MPSYVQRRKQAELFEKMGSTCDNLNAVWRRSFRLGRQEDAHEYLVALLDAMHESLLVGVKSSFFFLFSLGC